jgi:hypothetical protein
MKKIILLCFMALGFNVHGDGKHFAVRDSNDHEPSLAKPYLEFLLFLSREELENTVLLLENRVLSKEFVKSKLIELITKKTVVTLENGDTSCTLDNEKLFGYSPSAQSFKFVVLGSEGDLELKVFSNNDDFSPVINKYLQFCKKTLEEKRIFVNLHEAN